MVSIIVEKLTKDCIIHDNFSKNKIHIPLISMVIQLNLDKNETPKMRITNSCERSHFNKTTSK